MWSNIKMLRYFDVEEISTGFQLIWHYFKKNEEQISSNWYTLIDIWLDHFLYSLYLYYLPYYQINSTKSCLH